MTDDPTSLTNLHDIVVPDPVPWWPPAPVWYFLGLLALLGLGWLLLAWRRRRIAQRYRHLALQDLAQLQNAAKDPSQRQGALVELPVLLKRTALAAWPRERVAALTGADWWTFLDQKGSSPVFAKIHGAALQRLAYSPNPDLSSKEAKDLLRAVRKWIRNHRTPSTL